MLIEEAQNVMFERVNMLEEISKKRPAVDEEPAGKQLWGTFDFDENVFTHSN